MEFEPPETKFTSERKAIFISLAIIMILVLAYFVYPNQGKEEAITQPIEPEARDKSIVILPFTDQSPEGGQEWYSDCILEEVRKYLGVAYVLAGSVTTLVPKIYI